MINTKKDKQKRKNIAFCSALSATADGKLIAKRYAKVKDKKIPNVRLLLKQN